MLSTRSSRWIAGTCVACLVVATASWFLLIGPRRSHAAQLRDQSQSVHSANDTLRLQIAQLKAQFADLPSKRAVLVKVQQQLPPTAAMPALVRSLNGIADTTGVNLTGITPGAAVLASAAGGAAPAGAASAAGTPAPAGSTVIVPVSVSVTGDYFAATLFMKQLQTQLRRAFLVTGITVAPNSAASGADSSSTGSLSSSSGNAASGDIQLTITGQVFVLPTAPAAGSATGATTSGTTAGTTGGTSGATAR